MVKRAAILAGVLIALLLSLLASGDERPLRAADQAQPRIDAPAPTCYRPKEFTDVCYVEWAALSAAAVTPNYLISMSVSIDNRLRVYSAGFFQTSIQLAPDMFGPGFKVACGLPGASGDPLLGATHTYEIRTRDSSSAYNAASGSVTCPADVIPVSGATLEGPAFGATGASQPFTATAKPVTTTLPITYIFSGTDLAPSTLSGNQTQVANLTWNVTGTKTVTVEVENIAGQASAYATIRIQDPIAGLTASNNGPVAAGEEVQLVAQINGGTDAVFSWTSGDGRSATGRVVNFDYAEPGRYTATVTAANGVSGQPASTVVVVRAATLRTFLPWISSGKVR